MRALHLGVLASFALCASACECAAGEARTVVVVDATVQMGANLGQKRKLDWAKAAIGATAARLDAGSSFALWSFGGNPQKKCEDTSELLSPQTAGTALKSLDKAMSALQPKASRAPAMGALQAALKAPGLSEAASASVVMIAGTGDDCFGDICSVAGRLHGFYPNVKLTIFGLAMNEQAAANYTCAAKAMGGSFTAVKSGAELDKALRQALPQADAPAKSGAAEGASAPAKAAPADSAAAVANVAAPKEPPAQPPAEAPALPLPPIEPNVVLSAVLTPESKALDAGVTWEIYKVQTTPTGQTRLSEAPLWVGGGGQAKAKLPPGLYSARAAYGYASATAEFSVESAKVEKTVALDAGTIAVEALQTAGGAPAEGVFFVLLKPKTRAAREELGRSSETPALFHVNTGDYAVSALAGLAKLDATVKVAAGKVSVVRMALNVGTLDIKTLAAAGSDKPVPAWHRLTPLGLEAQKGAGLRITGASHRLQLPAGAYRLESVYGGAREERVVTIAAGQTTAETVILNVGEAKVEASAGKADKVCAVYEAGADRKSDPLDRAAGADIRFTLKAGRYDVECRNEGDGAALKAAQVTVVAGEVQPAKFED